MNFCVGCILLWFAISCICSLTSSLPFLFPSFHCTIIISCLCLAEPMTDWATCVALNNTLGQFPQSYPPPQISFSTTPNSVQCSSSTGMYYQSSASAVPSTTSQKHSFAAVPAASASSATTVLSQIPSSLQRLVRANLSATLPQASLPLSQGQSSSENQQSEQRYSHSITSCSNTDRGHNPIPLSIKSAAAIMTNPSDEVVTTPSTPLSPYCGQQGM